MHTAIYVLIAAGAFFILASDEMQKQYLPEKLEAFPYKQRQMFGGVCLAAAAYMSSTYKQQSNTATSFSLPSDLKSGSSSLDLSTFR